MKHCLACGSQYADEVQFCATDGTALVDLDATEKPEPLLGKLLDKKYKIERRLGEGGMGVVYQARHIHIESTVAIKVLHKDLVANPHNLERFRREARAAGRIRHPNAITVTDFGVDESNMVYIVMEYLEGITLAQLIRKKGRIAPEETVRIMRDVCAAVDAAHQKGVIHRDLKPDNIMLQTVDGQERVKVLDFGIAQLKNPSGASMSMELTQQGTVIGTPHYMSPEQCSGEELDPRSDVYSLGIILFEMLTGELPFKGDTTMGIAIKHMIEAPPSLCKICAEVPAPFETVVLKALAKTSDERQGSAAELALELEQALARSLRPGGAQGLDRTEITGGPGQHATAPTVEDKTLVQARTGVKALPETYILPSTPKPRPAVPGIRGYTQRIRAISLTSRTSLYVSLGAAMLVLLTVYIGWQVTVSTGSGGKMNPPEPEGPAIPANMILIPAGTFMLGRDSGDRVGEDEKPAHSVEVGTFYLGKFEVGNKDYQEFVVAANHPAPPGWNGTSFPPGQDNVPVTNVSWHDAVAYCAWLSNKTGFSFRLPTEEEWEYAAKGSSDERIYPWGNEFDQTFANSLERAKASQFGKELPLDVTRYSDVRSPFGTVNQAGNVAEWTASDAAIYPGSKYPPIQGTVRVHRGGSYLTDKYDLRTTARYWKKPGDRAEWLGFRVAMEVPEPR